MTALERYEYGATFNAEYQFKLGLLYLEEGHSGRPGRPGFFSVLKDEAKGLALIQRAAEQGAAMASDFLSMFYIGREDLQKGFMWKKKAAEQGLANAQTQLGILLLGGAFVPRDYFNACVWLTVAAANDAPGGSKFLEGVLAGLSPFERARVQKAASELQGRLPKISLGQHLEMVGLLGEDFVDRFPA